MGGAAAVDDDVASSVRLDAAVLDADSATDDGLLLATPFAVRLTYAAQSLTGTARGQVGFWQRLNS